MIRDTHSSTVSWPVGSSISGFAGASYGALTPVKSRISPARALAYNPLESRCSSKMVMVLLIYSTRTYCSGPLADVVKVIQGVSKSADLVSVNISQEVQIVLSGTQVRLNTAVSFNVAEADGLPALNNISGVSVHKLFWIGIQTIQLMENQGQKMVRVVTSAGTKEFPLS